MGKLIWRGKEVINKVHKAGYKALVDVGEIIGDESQKIVPKDTEELANSLEVTGDERNLEVSISYDTDNRYAIKIHEDMTLNHKPGETAKYLEIPLMSLGPGLLIGALKEEIEKELS